MWIFMAFGLFLQAQSPGLKKAKTYPDESFIQDYSIKFVSENADNELLSVVSDRNGYIQILSSEGLLRTRAGQFLFPGQLVSDYQDRPTSDKNIQAIGIYENNLIFLDDKALFSNAWAGKLYLRHHLPNAKIFSGGKDFNFLISDGQRVSLINRNGIQWTKTLGLERIIDIKYDETQDVFWILKHNGLYSLSPRGEEVVTVIESEGLTCMEVTSEDVVVGTIDGYFEVNKKSGKQKGAVAKNMPWPELTAVREIDGELWFGSTHGAMVLHENGKYSYYASKRWIPSDTVIDIASGPDQSVLILTSGGLGQICFKEMTLADKADYFEKVTRERHIRVGFNSILAGLEDGDITTGSLRNSDNDGLWTTMYLASQAFRYHVTRSEEALENVRESLEAIERLYTINPMKSGFPSRSYERTGYNDRDKKWRPAEDPEWDWKSTTSSDEAIGHVFVFGVIAEVVDEPEIQNKAVELLDLLMQHVVDNDFYLVDFDGQPTTWARWNPEYVNRLPVEVGDRKLNSSNIIAMLQSAYHFTKKEIYKEKAFELMDDHGYLENLMRPISEIGEAPEDADDWSKMLSSAWNHSDDEMYYLGYWGLYRHAFNDDLKSQYKKAILDHWEAERPEKEGLWNIMTAIVGDDDYDFEEAMWYLRKHPLDLITWKIQNSHRKDIEHMPENFRGQTIKEVLPPDELPIRKHNANRFALDGNHYGEREYSPGDIWLLPYWIGRYFGIIGE